MKHRGWSRERAKSWMRPYLPNLHLHLPLKAGALDKLEAFTSLNGPRFYGLPPPDSTRHVLLRREAWRVPERVGFGTEEVVPFRAGEMLPWKMHRELGGASSKCEQQRRQLMEHGTAMTASEFVWYEMWSDRVDCWWMGLPLPTQVICPMMPC